MSRGRKHSNDNFEESEVFSDQDFDADEFVDSMEEASARPKRDRRMRASGWRIAEERREARWLRDHLQDWDDWELEGTEH